jgi:hypothetical protein
MQNRHPVDELADIRAEIRRLEDREQELRNYLLEHPHDRRGTDYEALIGTQQRKRVDLRARRFPVEAVHPLRQCGHRQVAGAGTC